MNRMALLTLGASIVLCGYCLADDSLLCRSICNSEQSECKSAAQYPQKGELLPAPDVLRSNSLAWTASGAIPSQGTRALNSSGETNRKMERKEACNKSFERCVHECIIRPDINKEREQSESKPPDK